MAIKKIMVVDDSPTERAFMETMLKKRGFEVLLVDSGEAAIERSKSEQPDLILMDVVMPGLNGFQATRAITREEKTKHIPVIICTNATGDGQDLGLRRARRITSRSRSARPTSSRRSRRWDNGMARRTGLREFQISVAERIRNASARAALSSKLGFQVGNENWFVALNQVNEVIPVPRAAQVPLTHSWFRGVANIRGNLYSVLDFAAFQGGEPIGAGMERRVFLISERLIGGAGLLVSRMLGLRNPEQFARAARPADAAPWVGGVYSDAGGTRWMELDLPALVRERRFLEVGA